MSYRYDFIKRTNGSISNLDNLSLALDIPLLDLHKASNLPDQEKYVKLVIPKSDGKKRTVYNPHQLVRLVQRRVNSRIFHPKHKKGGLITWPSYLFGSIPNDPHSLVAFEGRDYVSCASIHCGSKSILKMDISDFFDNIHRNQVVNLFRNLLKFPIEVSNFLADICCYKGNVVQGALTSSYIASAILFDVEPNLVRRLHEKNLKYTRLVDDITISSKVHDYDFSYAKSLVIKMLHEKGLPNNENKTVVLSTSSADALVHGLRVSFKEPRLPSGEVAKIRANVQHVERFAKDPSFRTSRDYRKVYNRCLGRVNRLKQLGHHQHENLMSRLNRIKPLPCRSDIKKARRLVYKLKQLFKEYGEGFGYKRIYNRAIYDLNILGRTFKLTADSLRKRLQKIEPEYEN